MYTSFRSAELLAEAIATCLLPIHAALLAGALATTTAIFLSRHHLRRGVRASARRVALNGTLVILCSAALFAAVAAALEDGSALLRFDHALAIALRSTQSADTLHGYARLTRFGDTETLTVLAVVGAMFLAWRRQHLLAATWVVAIGGNSLLNVTLKSLFERVRPLHDHGFAAESSWSFPSGHSSGTVAGWGVLAYVALRLLPARWHLPALLCAVAIALSTALSRVVLQVHFASDVLAGLCSGTAWLTLCIATSELLRRRSWPAQGPPGAHDFGRN